jgi:putative membrane protein
MSVRDRINEASQEIHRSADALAYGARRVGRGTVAGALGGLVASWMMNQYQSIESRPVNVRKEELRLQYASANTVRAATKTEDSKGDAPTVKLAEQVSREMFDHPLTSNQKKMAGPVVHYGYGALVGALYGGLSELIPSISTGLGIPYATLLWLFGSETAVPALGLSKVPVDVPTEKHASDLSRHFVYGVTLDISRRILRLLL